MNLSEAYSILELSPNSSADEVKKKYREFTKKYHPDINKEENSEDRFKKINEAYNCINNGKNSDADSFTGFHNPFVNKTTFQAENIQLYTTISFKESVLGCQKELCFSRNSKCTNCNGNGFIRINNGCDRCHGKGQIVGKQGNMIFTRTCDKCMGQNNSSQCNICLGTGHVNMQVSINVNIPGGVVSGNILRLSGFGNYIGSFINMDQYTEAHLHITVIMDEGLTLENNDVISRINITLLEALQGSQKTVKTILGDYIISIPPLSKNKEEINIPNLGVNGMGNQKVILDVSYPSNIQDVINVLSNDEELFPCHSQ